jgi:hypothetical protein
MFGPHPACPGQSSVQSIGWLTCSGESKIEDLCDVINKSVPCTLLREEGVRGVTELHTLAQGIHGLKHKAAGQYPQGWSNVEAALAWVIGKKHGKGGDDDGVET